MQRGAFLRSMAGAGALLLAALAVLPARAQEEPVDRGGTIDNLAVHLASPITAQRVRLLINETSGELPTIVAFDLF